MGPFHHACGAFVAIVALGTGGAVISAQSRTTGSPDAVGPDHRLWKSCAEHVVVFQTDPTPLQAMTGPEHPLQLVNGRAVVSILIQRCPQWRIGEQDAGPSDEVHVWVALQTPEAFRPLEGVAYMMPTRRWYSVYKGVRSSAPRRAYAAAGLPAVPIDSVELDHTDQDITGSVTMPGGARLSWQAAANTPPWPSLGVHHEVYGRDGEGRVRVTQVQGVADLDAWQAPGRLTIDGGIARGPGSTPLIAPGTYPAQVHSMPLLWAFASLGLLRPG